jgi:hypothetical protein
VESAGGTVRLNSFTHAGSPVAVVATNGILNVGD